jgi:hypothetical protein
MHVIYSDQASGFEPGQVYANPRYFESIRRGATSITVVGDHPNIVAAAEALGIPCDVVQTGEPDGDEPPEAIRAGEGSLSVAKGPRGAFYIVQNGKRVSSGFKTQAEAIAAVPSDDGATLPPSEPPSPPAEANI